jgi:2-keto-4-pentenoate hydratase
MTDRDAAPQTALENGMREQRRIHRERIARGMPRAGWKICVNDARMQKKLGLDDAFVGFLDGSRALADGDAWKAEPGSVLAVEPEIAIRFGAAVRAGDDPHAVRSAIEGVAPAVEVLDWRSAKLDLESLASSSSYHAGFVTGALRSLDDVPAISADCPRFERAGERIGVPDPRLVPQDSDGLVRLVARVAAFLSVFGESIEAGDWLLCGACTNPARVDPGDSIVADFASLGAVRVRFER